MQAECRMAIGVLAHVPRFSNCTDRILSHRGGSNIARFLLPWITGLENSWQPQENAYNNHIFLVSFTVQFHIYQPGLAGLFLLLPGPCLWEFLLDHQNPINISKSYTFIFLHRQIILNNPSSPIILLLYSDTWKAASMCGCQTTHLIDRDGCCCQHSSGTMSSCPQLN